MICAILGRVQYQYNERWWGRLRYACRTRFKHETHDDMNITENAIPDEMRGNIKGCAGDAATMLNLDLSRSSPAEIVEAVDSFMHAWQRGNRPELSEDDDLSLTMGSLWGEQLVNGLGWEWAGVTFHDHDDSKAVGVFSPDRALAIYPFHFIYGCMENGAPVTIMLSYNMLQDGSRIPALPPGGYENVMDNVHHIVPRD